VARRARPRDTDSVTSTAIVVIVPLDGSGDAERALPVAEQLAARIGGATLLVSSRFGPDDGTLSEYLERTASTRHPVPSVRVIEDRLAHNAIVQVAAETPGSLVVMAAHGRGGIGQALLGSVTEDVLRCIEEPIVVVGPAVVADWSSEGDRVVACSDGSPQAGGIVIAAASLLRQLRLRDVTVVRVGDEAPSGELDPAAGALEREGFVVRSEVLAGGDVVDAITRYAREAKPALLILSTHGRSGLARVSLGSVMSGVIRNAPCPALITPPRFSP
jgi:nucleotide-binding universal stress UspA family protein